VDLYDRDGLRSGAGAGTDKVEAEVKDAKAIARVALKRR
jgi:hypothetical protein